MLLHSPSMNVILKTLVVSEKIPPPPEQNYPESSKLCAAMCNKISFLAVTPNLSILGHMLLHKLYINVAIANILMYRNSL